MDLKLKKLTNFEPRKGPVLLIIMDGVAFGKQDESDGVYLAKTPVLDKLLQQTNKIRLKAHGIAVGLPTDDDMGNSEVGHNALGAGRKFDQGAKLVNQSIESGEIFESENWKKVIKIGKSGGTVHFLGLLSDGNVHSHVKHLNKFLDKCVDEGIKKVRIHSLLDGRDVPGKSALTYIQPFVDLFTKIKTENGFDYNFASGGGRMITTMDRYNADWDIVKRGWEAHVLGIGRKFKSITEAVETYYVETPEKIDQYLDPFVIVDENDKPIGTIEDGDTVVMMNFRGDRAIEISSAFEAEDFDRFDRVRVPKVFYAGMMEYDGDLHIPKNYLVKPPKINRSISEYMCAEDLNTFAISETQKFGHVTYFWNGNKSGYVCEDRETYIEVPSDKIEFDKAPRMKADEITEKTIELLKSGKYQFGRINYPNGDMVGHTGIMNAVIKSVEAVDEGLAKLLPVIDELGGIALITADHGNADEMFTEKNGVRTPKTSHSLNPVPFIVYDPNFNGEYKMAEVDTPGLTNIAGTILNLLGYENVEDYDKSLIEFIK